MREWIVHISSFLGALGVITWSSLAPAIAQDAVRHQDFFSRAEVFLEMAQRVGEEEPYLYYNPQFREEGAWTRHYQRQVARELMSGEFKLLTLIPAKHVRLERIRRAYSYYGQRATTLLPEVFREIQRHAQMIPDLKDRQVYLDKFTTALDTLFPTNEGHLVSFETLDCDYVAQPMNTLWFSIHAMHLLDGYASHLFPQRWPQARAELMQRNRIRSLTRMRELVSQARWREILSLLPPKKQSGFQTLMGF